MKNVYEEAADSGLTHHIDLHWIHFIEGEEVYKILTWNDRLLRCYSASTSVWLSCHSRTLTPFWAWFLV